MGRGRVQPQFIPVGLSNRLQRLLRHIVMVRAKETNLLHVCCVRSRNVSCFVRHYLEVRTIAVRRETDGRVDNPKLSRNRAQADGAGGANNAIEKSACRATYLHAESPFSCLARGRCWSAISS